MFGLSRKNSKHKKAVVIGIDGVPCSLLEEYRKRGIMPELARLCEEGQLMPMKSSLPEISSVAWTGFMTGVNPGRHGIFGFMEINHATYDYTFPNFSSLKERPFWERENIRTVAFNIPQTYPAAPMNGAMVSGFVALDLKKATYPEKVYQYLSSINYSIDVNSKLAAENPEAFFGDLFATFEKRKQAIEHLYSSEDWQLFIGTVTETDRLHHFFFDSAREGRYYPVFEKFYRSLDQFIGTMAKKARNDGALFLTCSDHGFTPIKSEVYVNSWLKEQGYLKIDGSGGLKGITPDSRVFCLDPSRLYLHREKKYARGGVRAEDSEAILREVLEKLAALTFEGVPVIKRVYRNDEIFQGPLAGNGPDLYVLPNHGFDLKGTLAKDRTFGTTHFRGMHTYNDAHLFVIGASVNNKDVHIEDIPGIILGAVER